MHLDQIVENQTPKVGFITMHLGHLIYIFKDI